MKGNNRLKEIVCINDGKYQQTKQKQQQTKMTSRSYRKLFISQNVQDNRCPDSHGRLIFVIISPLCATIYVYVLVSVCRCHVLG